jgi:hypothetical protein
MTKLNFIIAICCCFLFVNTASSQTKRYVKTVATGTGSGSSWANASGNLQAMIDASANNDEVWVAKGTYRPTTAVGYNASHVAYTDDRHKSFYLHTGVKLYGSFAGTETTLTQRQLAANKTFLSGDLLGNDGTGFSFTNNNENAYHVIIAISAHTIRIDGFTISGGNTTGMPATYLNDAPVYTPITAGGAGIYAYDCDYYITSNIFINNYSTGNGGAVYNNSVNEIGDLTCSLFINNRAAQGSALYVSNSGADYADSYLTNCTVFKNVSSGATVYTESSKNRMYIYNSIVMYNYGVGKTIDSTLVTALYSAVQLNSLTPMDPGPDPLDPYFTNPLDPDGADNILGTSDDGLIPHCGKAIGGGYNFNLPATDIRDAARIQHGTIDMGVYETPLIQAIDSVSISVEITIPGPRDPDDDDPFNDLPTPTGACEGGGVSFGATLSGNNNGGVFQWKKNGINVGTNSNYYAPLDFHQGDQIKVTYASPAGCAPATVLESNTITLNSVSAGNPVLSAISGPTNACPYMNGPPVAYTVRKDPNAVIYVWYFSVPGATIVSHPNGHGVNDTIVLVSYTTEYTGGSNIAVEARSWCGWSSWKHLGITTAVPSATGTITGPADVCPFMQSATNPAGTAVTYSVRKVLGAGAYTWTVPAGATINAHSGTGVNDTAITVTYSSSFISGTVTAQATNGCGARAAKTLSISKKPSGTPGSITGPTDACPLLQSATNPAGTQATYTIRKVLYATSYTWGLPANATATHPGGSGINDTIIKVTYSGSFVSGSITVISNTNCNSSAVRSLAILRKVSSTPGTITGSTAVCGSMQSPSNPSGTPVDYTIRKVVYATSYTWTLPAGASATHPGGSGMNDTILRVTYNNSFTGGVITVKSNTNCSTSATKSLSIMYRLPSTPVTITDSVATISYSLASLPSYSTSVLWTAPASGTIISGQGTLSLVVEYAGPTAVTDTIRVVAVNDCGTSGQRKLKVAALAGTCRAGKNVEQNNEVNIPVTATKVKTPLSNSKEEFDITAMPNPSNQYFTLRLTGTDINTPIILHVVDAAGRLIESNQNIQGQQTIMIGENYKTGIYFATIMQGKKKKIVRLIKL